MMSLKMDAAKLCFIVAKNFANLVPVQATQTKSPLLNAQPVVEAVLIQKQKPDFWVGLKQQQRHAVTALVWDPSQKPLALHARAIGLLRYPNGK